MVCCPHIYAALCGDILSIWQSGRDQAFSQAEDHSPQRIGSLLGITVSVKLFQQTGPADALSPAVDEKHQQMEHFTAEALAQQHRLPPVSHVEAAEHLNMNHIFHYFCM